MRRVVIPSGTFVRAARKFVKRRSHLAQPLTTAIRRLEADAFDPRLRTHKLKGELAGCWSASAGYDLRIVFQIVQHEENEAILLLSVGTHDEVY